MTSSLWNMQIVILLLSGQRRLHTDTHTATLLPKELPFHASSGGGWGSPIPPTTAVITKSPSQLSSTDTGLISSVQTSEQKELQKYQYSDSKVVEQENMRVSIKQGEEEASH